MRGPGLQSSSARVDAATTPDEGAPIAAASDASTSAPAPKFAPSPPWLARGLRELSVHDPVAAGRLLLQLLPAHGLVESRSLRYDLVVEEVGCLSVTLQDGRVEIDEQPAPRPVEEVDFRLTAPLAGLGVLLAGGRLRRLMTARRADVVPNRHRLDTLRTLAQAPLGLRALHSAGVRLDPTLAYRLLTRSFEPQWTAGHRFTLLHEVEGSPAHRCVVYVDGERPVSVLAPSSRNTQVTVVVRCEAALFVPLLCGELTHREERKLVHGNIEAFTDLQDWIARIEWTGAYGG